MNSFLSIDHSGVLWVATPNGLLRFDRDREQFSYLMASAMACRPVPSSASSKITMATFG